MTSQVVALVALLALALVARRMTGTWAHPASLFAVAWAAFLAASTFLLPGAAPATDTAWVICVVAAIVVCLAGPSAIAPGEAVVPRGVRLRAPLRAFVPAGTIAVPLSALLTQRANGISLGDSLSLAGVLAAAQQVTVLRYEVALHTPASAWVLLALGYVAALVSPYVAAAESRPTRRAATLVGPAAGGAIYVALTTARAPFIILVAISASSWLIVRAVTEGGRPALPSRALFGGAVLAVVGFLVFALGAASRIGLPITQVGPRLLQSSALYAGGSIPAFERWQQDRSPGLSGGFETFAGIAQFIDGDRTLGSAYEFAHIGDGLTTNVYTVLRPLASDFSLPGAVLFLALGTTLAAIAYARAVRRGSLAAASFASVWGAFVLFAQTTSLFSFANVTIGLLIGAYALVRFAKLIPVEQRPEERLQTRSSGPEVRLPPVARQSTSWAPRLRRTQ